MNKKLTRIKLRLIEKLLLIKEEGLLQQYEMLLNQSVLQNRAENSITAIVEEQTISLNRFQTNNKKFLKNNAS